MAAPLFFYGSLRDPELIEIVIGRPLRPGETRPARAPGHATIRLKGEAYPVLAEAPGEDAEGLLLDPPGPEAEARLAFFEEAEYGLAPITVETADGRVEARFFAGTGKRAADGARRWRFDAWARRDRAVAVEATRELMAHYGRLPVEEIDSIWFGIMRRARQRARGAASRRPARLSKGPDGAAGVETIERIHAYASFLAVDEHRLRVRRFDGGWLGPLDRSVTAWGDAVAVLPYDAASDRVWLIEQFRPGVHARRDPRPWCLEAIAGLVDADERPEDAARREAREEARLDLGRLERVAAFYPSPGLSAEHVWVFVGEAALGAAGEKGTHGLESENEDIRSVVVPFADALEAVRSGEVNTGPLVVALYWLAAERDRLRSGWT